MLTSPGWAISVAERFSWYSLQACSPESKGLTARWLPAEINAEERGWACPGCLALARMFALVGSLHLLAPVALRLVMTRILSCGLMAFAS